MSAGWEPQTRRAKNGWPVWTVPALVVFLGCASDSELHPAPGGAVPSRVDGMVFIEGGPIVLGTDSAEIPRLMDLTGARRADPFLAEVPRRPALRAR